MFRARPETRARTGRMEEGAGRSYKTNKGAAAATSSPPTAAVQPTAAGEGRAPLESLSCMTVSVGDAAVVLAL